MNALTPVPAVTFPTNPKVGQVFYNWVWNGSVWVCQGPAGSPVALIKPIGASGVYWPSPGLTFVMVECVGAGGGGGAALATYTGSNIGWICGGGGGGSGAYARRMLAAALVINGVQVTIGQGGAGGSIPALPNPINGAAGGATSFGSFVIAAGGGGGYTNDMVHAPGVGGNPGSAVASVGDFTANGSAGDLGGSGLWNSTIAAGATTWGGSGAGSYWEGKGQTTILGAGLPGLPDAYNGNAGASAGAGGNGGASGTNVLTGNGGAGAPGFCVVTEFCFGNTSLVQDCGPCWTDVPSGFGNWPAPAGFRR